MERTLALRTILFSIAVVSCNPPGGGSNPGPTPLPSSTPLASATPSATPSPTISPSPSPSPTSTPKPSPSPSPTPKPSPSPSPTPNPNFALGVCTHGDAGPQTASLPDMGASWIRADFVWEILEPTKGQWNFGYTDALVANAVAHGLKVYAVLAYTPAWASSNGKITGRPSVADWTNFVQTTVLRYKGKVAAWGIWNEANLGQFWAGSINDYINILLKPAIPVIRQHDPGSQIAGPDLAQNGSPLNTGQFLKAIKDSGASNDIDIISMHVYGRSKASEFKTNINNLGNTMKAAGLGDRKVMITEFGCDLIEMARALGGVNAANIKKAEDQEAIELPKMILDMSKLNWLNGAMIYDLNDDPNHLNDFLWGIYRIDDSKRPVFDTIKKVMSEISHKP